MRSCVYCKRLVEGRPWQRVQGWERKAVGDSRRGGSDIVLRESCDEFACPGCIEKLRVGVSPDQEALI